MKKTCRAVTALLLCAVLMAGSVTGVLAVTCSNYSSWFEPNYTEMNQLSLIPDSFAGYDLRKNITRGEMATLAVHAYNLITKNTVDPSRTDYFSDTSDNIIVQAYELGIVGGYPDGTFRPNQKLTRQEFFQIIRNFCNAAAYHPTSDSASLSGFVDASAVADWALDATKVCVKNKYVGGTSTDTGLALKPGDYTSREEAMAMFLRCYKGLNEYYYYQVLSANVVEDTGNVTVTDTNQTLYVKASTLNVRSSWSTSGSVIGTLSYGDSVTVTGTCSNDWRRISYNGTTGYVSGAYLSDEKVDTSTYDPSTAITTGSATAIEIANFAYSFVGYNYVYGGASPSAGFDCSGLMYYVLTQYGYSMNRVADDQMKQGSAVDRANLQVGDLVFFGYNGYANHVGMYIGNGNFVHASTPSTGVRVNSLNETYYNTRYIGARRIIG